MILMDGVIILDKSETLTSMECVERVKEILGVRKAGHSGTLDPKVTGLLLIALGESRKAMPVFSGLDKEYTGTMHIHRDFNPRELQNIIKDFVGEIEQIPPRKSAVVRKPRKRKVYSLKITKISGRDVQFKVKCEAGTYIRKLCSDIGEALGTGAHMTSLRRTGIGPFTEKDSITLENLNNGIISLEKALERIGLKRVLVKEGSIQKVRNGSPIRKEDIEKGDDIKNEKYAGIFHKNKILALGIPREGYIKVERVFNI